MMQAPLTTQDELRMELHALRSGSKIHFMFLILGVWFIYFWVTYSVISIRAWWVDLYFIFAFLILGAFSIVVYDCRERHHLASALAVVASAFIVQALVTALFPSPVTLAAGACIIIIVNTFLGSLAALLAVPTAWLAATVAWHMGQGSAWSGSDHLAYLALYGLTWTVEFLAVRPLGSLLEWALSGWVRAREALSEVQDRRGELYRVVRSLEEATVRIERMNEELILARRDADTARAQKARFVATVSHELRGPLNLILGFSRLMVLSPELYGTALPPEYRQDLTTIYRNTQHLVALVDDVLDLSQIDAERLPLVRDRIDLVRDVVDEAIAIVRPLADRHGLEIERIADDDLPWILGDQVRLRQALLNLLHNAIRFTPRGTISVKVALEEQRLTVSVADTGIGLRPEQLRLLFQEFSQAQQPDGERKSGTGLGLSITKSLVELHGGEIWAESTLGVGTVVTFTLPLMGAPSSQRETIRTGEVVHPIRGGPVCIAVHRNPDVIRLLARHIEGCRVVGVSAREDIPQLIDSLRPRAILTAADELEPVRTLLEGKGAEVPIIGCSFGYQDPLWPDNIIAHLVKPVAPDVIAALMARFPSSTQLKVLIVDDDPDAVRLVDSMLNLLPHPYEILRAYNGPQALALMRARRPDLVFLDLIMPGLSGEDTLRAMGEEDGLADIPVVVISAKDRSEATTRLETPLTVQCTRPVQISDATKCLSALVATLSPHYLSDESPSPQPTSALQARRASAGRQRRPD